MRVIRGCVALAANQRARGNRVNGFGDPHDRDTPAALIQQTGFEHERHDTRSDI